MGGEEKPNFGGMATFIVLVMEMMMMMMTITLGMVTPLSRCEDYRF